MSFKINITSQQIQGFFENSAGFLKSKLSDINARVTAIATAAVAKKESEVVPKQTIDDIDPLSPCKYLSAIALGVPCVDSKLQRKQEEITTPTSACVEASMQVEPSKKEPKELGYETLQVLLDQIHKLLEESVDFIDKEYFAKQVQIVKESISLLYTAQQPYPKGLSPADLLAHPLTKQIQSAKQAVGQRCNLSKIIITDMLTKLKELQEADKWALRPNDEKRTDAELSLQEHLYDGSLSAGAVEVDGSKMQQKADQASFLLSKSRQKDPGYVSRELVHSTLEKISMLFQTCFPTT